MDRHALWKTIALISATSALLMFGLGGPAFAAEGSIDHVEADNRELRVLYSLPGLGSTAEPDLDTVSASIGDRTAPAAAALASTGSGRVTRTMVLAIDVSLSMRQDDRFAEAKKAAQIFLETAPLDVRVGIVTFADEVEVVQVPTLNRQATIDLLDDLELSRQTRLYDGVQQAVRTAGDSGLRNVLVLSDGRDTSSTPLEAVTEMVGAADVQVDVIAVGQSGQAVAPLAAMAEVGGGTVLETNDPEALSAMFEDEAQALAEQVLVTVQVPADISTTEATLSVSIQAAGQTFSDSAFVTIDVPSPPKAIESVPAPVLKPALVVSTEVMLAGLTAVGIGLMLLLAGAFGALSGRNKESIEDQIAAYGVAPDRGARPSGDRPVAANKSAHQHVAAQAVGVAQRALAGNKGFEATLGSKLEAAGMSMRPAEWLLAHAGLALGAALLGFLLSAGSLLVTLVLLVVGAAGPYVYLGMKRSRRLKAFNSQLPETLQLMSGSLSAGLSLAQSIDTVVREGSDPMASEFKRALIEARLGVEIEEGLDSVAQRMQSDDFRWVVMAIRIQREVGGNLAELLLQVSATMREREYLRRQVKTLSAEGRMSAWILGGLPPVFLLYMLLLRRDYLDPMLHSTLGWLMFGLAAVMMAVGAFWMSRVVKVEV